MSNSEVISFNSYCEDTGTHRHTHTADQPLYTATKMIAEDSYKRTHWRRTYWAGRAPARPLFAPNGQAMMFALPHFPHWNFKNVHFTSSSAGSICSFLCISILLDKCPQMLNFFLSKTLDNVTPRAVILASNMHRTKSFVGWGFAPDLIGGAYSAPQIL